MEPMLKFKAFIKEDATLQQELEKLELLDLQEAKAAKTKPPAAPEKPAEEGKVSNNTKGVLHEILVGKHLNGGKHMERHENEHGETPEQAHKRLKDSIHPNDYKKIDANAKSAAAHIHKNLEASHPGHKITAVTHTSKPGDTEKVTGVKATQKEDSSDVYVTTHHPKHGTIHHGVSLKVSDKSSKKIPSSSLGMESGGSKAREHFNAHKKAILKDYPHLAGKNKEARKEVQKNDPKMQADVKKRNQALLHKVAHSHAAELQHHLDTGNHEHVVKHIREVLHAHSTPAQQSGKATFQKHTTYQTAKGVQHHAEDPSQEHEHILKDHKNITVKSSGGSVHFYHNGKKFASQAHKFDSQSDPLSSLKSAGKAA